VRDTKPRTNVGVGHAFEGLITLMGGEGENKGVQRDGHQRPGEKTSESMWALMVKGDRDDTKKKET